MASKARQSERGAALIELSLIIPVLLLLLTFTFEVGRAFHQYLVLSQVAYEGVRDGIQLQGMKSGCFDTFPDIWKSAAPTDGSLGHWMAQDRVKNLIGNYIASKVLTLDHDSGNWPTIRTKFVNQVGAGEDSDACTSDVREASTFSMKISGTYRPLIFSVIAIPMSVELKGPYLSEAT